MLHNQGTALVGTMRKGSAGELHGHDFVKNWTKSVRKKVFSRKFDLFERELDPRMYGPDQYLQLGYFLDQRDKCVIMCTNDARLFGVREHSHISKNLNLIEKPEIVENHNKTEHYVDEMDRMLSAYTCARAFKGKSYSTLYKQSLGFFDAQLFRTF